MSYSTLWYQAAYSHDINLLNYLVDSKHQVDLNILLMLLDQDYIEIIVRLVDDNNHFVISSLVQRAVYNENYLACLALWDEDVFIRACFEYGKFGMLNRHISESEEINIELIITLAAEKKLVLDFLDLEMAVDAALLTQFVIKKRYDIIDYLSNFK